MDNRIFNVNGRGKEMLLATLSLASVQEGLKFKGWYFNPKAGLVLTWCTPNTNSRNVSSFLCGKDGLDAEGIVDSVWDWLQSDQAKTVPLGEWEYNCNHDGHNTMGWRVYCEDWGHVDNDAYTICAVKPCYMWHGK